MRPATPRKILECIRGCGATQAVEADVTTWQCGRCTQRRLGAIEVSSAALELPRCPHHRRYVGRGAPRSNCKTCAEIFRLRTGEGLDL